MRQVGPELQVLSEEEVVQPLSQWGEYLEYL